MPKPPVPAIGKPVRLSPNTGVQITVMQALNNPFCQPPGSECPTFSVEDLQVTAGFCDIHLLVFKIAGAKKENLDLRIEISASDYTELLFMTGKLTVPVHAGTSTLVGLDPHAAKAAQQFFVSGNSVTLSVFPKDPGVKVEVGKRSNHRGEAHPPGGESR